jgi:hypothetical protein
VVLRRSCASDRPRRSERSRYATLLHRLHRSWFWASFARQVSTTISASPAPAAPRRIYFGIGVCSIGILMMEILLTRIFSFTVWYHLAYLTISTALLGFGAAGSILSAYPRLIEKGVSRIAGVCSAAAGVTLLISVAILASNPLEPSGVLLEPVSFGFGLLGYYVAITIPFFLGGVAVAAPLSAHSAEVNRLYAADLLGAGLGCVAAVAALAAGDGAAALFVCAAILVAAGAIYTFGERHALLFGGLALVLLAAAPVANRVLTFVPVPSKEVGRAISQEGTRMLYTRWSPVNRVDLYQKKNPKASFWTTWGLAQNYRGPRPDVLSIQYDGHNGSNVFNVVDENSMQMLDSHLLRTPYVLLSAPRVMAIGVGGGIDVLNALRRGAAHVTGVELQPITVELLTGRLTEFTGGSFLRPDVELVPSEGRHFVRASDDVYDLIQITAVDTFSAQTTGAYVLAESYLYTVEAISDYLDHLADDGMISVVMGDQASAEEAVSAPTVTRLAMIVREALARRGVVDPAGHVVITAQFKSFSGAGRTAAGADRSAGLVMADLLVKKSPFTTAEIERLEAFLEPNGFEFWLAPQRSGDEMLARLYAAGDERREELLSALDVFVTPVTDDRPFFYHFLPWSSLFKGERTIWYLPGSTTGLLMLAIMLGQALLLGTALILLPLLRQANAGLSAARTVRYLIYFLSLGIGFMLIEISFVQKYVLVLGYPTYSLSVTIFSLLVFAALGAWLSRLGWGQPRSFLVGLLLVTVGLVCIEVSILPVLRDRLIAAPLASRIAVTVLLQLPLGIALGMYFPTGVELIRRTAPRMVPWAWGVNGVASVASSVLAVILGMTIGFSGVALLAAAVYTIGTLALLAELRASGAGR